jgi:hypothetical protein
VIRREIGACLKPKILHERLSDVSCITSFGPGMHETVNKQTKATECSRQYRHCWEPSQAFHPAAALPYTNNEQDGKWY